MLVCVRVRACACVRLRVRARVCGHVHDFSVPFTTPLPALSRTHLLVDNHCSFCLSFYYSIRISIVYPNPYLSGCLVLLTAAALLPLTHSALLHPHYCHNVATTTGGARTRWTWSSSCCCYITSRGMQHHCNTTVCVCWSTYYASTSTSVVGMPVRSCHNPIIIILPILITWGHGKCLSSPSPISASDNTEKTCSHTCMFL